jgi:hypothetical protein
MQVLRSRAQARASCRCGSCLHSAVARRNTSAASKRRLRFSDVFTACYSTILATAAFADAKVKEDRRKEWDRVIAEAKAEIPKNEPEFVEGAQSQSVLDSLRVRLPPVSKSSEVVHESIYKTHKRRWVEPGSAVPPRIQETSWENRLKELDMQLKEVSLSPEPLAEQELVGPRSSDLDLDNEWEETLDVELPPREPKNKLHLDKMEEMVARLVDRLLLQTNIHSVRSTSAPTKDVIQWEMNGIAQRIESLRKGFTRLPTYSWDDVESVQEQRHALHRSLTTLCSKATASKSSIDLTIVKICYNLLISTAPPSIATYNLLLKELNRLRKPKLAQIVVDSFLDESEFKLNKVTGRLILDHYRIKKDLRGFQTTAKKMGGHLESMRIKKRHVSDLSYPGTLEWALTKKVIRRDAHLYQKMPRGIEIFDSLIRGSLEMMGVRCAIRYVRAALREGYEVKPKLLCSVIRACLIQLDFQAGISLVRAILSRTEQTDLSPTFNSEVRHYIHELLNFCGLSSSSNLHQDLPFRVSGDALQKLLRHMQIESITDSVEQLGNRISTLKNMLCVAGIQSSRCLQQSSTRSNLAPVNRAIKLLEAEHRKDLKRARRRQKYQAARRWVRLQSLESMLATHAEQITRNQAQIIPMIFRILSTEQKGTYLESIKLLEQRDQVVSIPDRFKLLSRFLRPQVVSSIPELHQSPGRTESQSEIPLERTNEKSPLPTDAAKPQYLVSLLPMLPVS